MRGLRSPRGGLGEEEVVFFSLLIIFFDWLVGVGWGNGCVGVVKRS